MALIVLDASVVIAFLDAHDAHHRSAVGVFTSEEQAQFVLPASAYAEVLVGPARRGPAAMRVVEEALTDLPVQVQAITREIAARAAIIRATRRVLPLPDALVLATGDVVNADRVLTADQAWPRVSRRAKVI